MKIEIDNYTLAKLPAWREELILLTYNESTADNFLETVASEKLKRRFEQTEETGYLDYGGVMRVHVHYDYVTQYFTINEEQFKNVDEVLDYAAKYFVLQKTAKKRLAFWKRPVFYTAEEATQILKNKQV